MAGVSSQTTSRSKRSKSEFRVGKVKGYLRGKVWYLCYFENGKRLRPRVGADKSAAERIAAQINGQLAGQAPTFFSFEDISLKDLRTRWLEHHEHVLRSSLATIGRYRTATDHLLAYASAQGWSGQASQLTALHAERFVKYLRSIEVAPNGHPNSPKRPLRDKGVLFILETCRAMFTYAHKRRHLAPYADNPFSLLDLGRIPVEDAKPIRLLTADEETRFFEGCNDWERPIFLTLALTGIRPGELVHLLINEDLDLDEGILKVRNKPDLGWQVKTRSERSIPLVTPLRDLLVRHIADRKQGLVFRRERYRDGVEHQWSLREQARSWLLESKQSKGELGSRVHRQRTLIKVWTEAGLIRPERIRLSFIRRAKSIGRADCTAPKIFRHAFATMLQDANVDPLIRCELMGHSTGEHGDLGMTGVYTHTRAATKRDELTRAMSGAPAFHAAEAARARLG
jgi:integrase